MLAYLQFFEPQRFFDEENLVVASRKAGEIANVTVQALRRNISALIGSGGNIAALPGGDGKLIIDSGFLGTRSKIADALSSLGPDPIKHLVNTHWHFDHTDGNEWMHSAGATITAHENTRKHLSTSTRVEGPIRHRHGYSLRRCWPSSEGRVWVAKARSGKYDCGNAPIGAANTTELRSSSSRRCDS